MTQAIHLLDLDVISDLGDRARSLFSLVELRCYTAALIGRLTQRAPYGSGRAYPLAIGVPSQVAFNDSKDRALLVYAAVDSLIPVTIVYSPSIDSGSTNFARQSNQAGGVPPAQFVLKPGEQLFARSLNVLTQVVVSTEWY